MKIRLNGNGKKPPPPEPDPVTYPQLVCFLCGESVDLPAVWSCPCGLYRTCYRSPCVLRVPVRHRDKLCERQMTEADELLAELRAKGFAFRADNGKLIVSPVSKLTPEEKASLKAHRDEILAILVWEAM